MNYPAIIRARDVRRDNAAVRRQLRRLLKREIACQQHHVEAWGERHDAPTCGVCHGMQKEREGILRAIRFFGGRSIG